MIKVLITGANSYIGTSFEKYIINNNNFQINTLDMLNPKWNEHDFSKYDCIYHVAGIAHDTGNKKDVDLYYHINRDLTLETAHKAKKAGVKQFIYMSSMLVYNGCKERIITVNTKPKVKGCYGDSKLQADLKLQNLNSSEFQVAIIRPPMIFGPGCRGNFPRLVKLAEKLKIFPNFKNKRSMLYIDNLCEFLKLLIESKKGGIYYPQNEEYYCSSEIVKKLSIIKGKKIWFTNLLNWLIYILKPFNNSVNKLFGDLYYDKQLSSIFDNKYIVVDNENSLKKYMELK